MKIPNVANIQDAIDQQIAARGLGQYVDYVRYIPQGGDQPTDATHVLSLTSVSSGEAVIVAIKTKGFYGAIANAVLAVI